MPYLIGTSISSLLNPPERLVGYHQPHLVCIGQPNATAQYVIVAEKHKVAIPLEDYGLSFAIDKLFKMIWPSSPGHKPHILVTSRRDSGKERLYLEPWNFGRTAAYDSSALPHGAITGEAW
ncbi:hypothetical protein N1851_032346 [Merluccius polli]|uniref:Uncharacterized protein n=1 Tax=Merluccius polli TaxID=89951 RepID=A0AA47M336_MERPO|nr:hypothetical protein N1851_032346 [Merluccius polli]